MLHNSLYNFLFEAPIDVWLKKYPNILRQEAEPIIDKFLKLKDLVFLPDPVQYSIDELKKIIEIIDLSKKEGMKKEEIKWLTKQIKLNPNLSIEEIRDEYIFSLKTYVKNKKSLKPLSNYKNITELNKDIEEQSSEIDSASLSHQKGILLHHNGWTLSMPHTTAASCETGAGTEWCTARTDSQNLFLNYVARGDNDIILFYITKDEGNPRSNPWDKLSVGFINGMPSLNKEYGGLTVNAKQQGFNDIELKELIGEETYNLFMDKMLAEAERLKGKHPAKQELVDLVQKPKLLQKKLNSFKGEEELKDFVELILEQPNITLESFQVLAGSKDSTVRKLVASHENTPIQILNILAEDFDTVVVDTVRRNMKVTVEINEKILEQGKKDKELFRLIRIGQTDPRQIFSIRNSFLRAQLTSETTDPELLEKLSKDISVTVQESVAINDSTKKTTLLVLAKSSKENVLNAVIDNSNLVSSDEFIFNELIKNPASKEKVFLIMIKRFSPLPNHIYENLLNKNSDVIYSILITNNKTPEYVINNISFNKHISTSIKIELIDNNVAPIEAIYEFAKYGEDSYLLNSIAESPKITSDIVSLILQKQLARNTRLDMFEILAVNENLKQKDTEALYNEVIKQDEMFRKIVFNKLSRNKNLSLPLIEKLSTTTKNVIFNENCPANVLEKIYFQYYDKLSTSNYTTIASRKNITTKIAEDIVNAVIVRKSLVEEVLVTLLNNPHAPASILVQFVKGKYSNKAISNQSFPLNLLIKFATGKDQELAIAALGNKKIPLNIIVAAANSPSKAFRMAVAHNEKLPANLLEKLINDPEKLVRLSSISNPNITHDQLMLLGKDPAPVVAGAARNHVKLERIQDEDDIMFETKKYSLSKLIWD